MLYVEFRRHLGKAGMTINDFAAYLDVRPASVSNYSKSGSVPRTYAIIAILLGEAADRGIECAPLLGKFGVTRTTPTCGNVKQLDLFRASREQALAAEKKQSVAKIETDNSQGTPGTNQREKRR